MNETDRSINDDELSAYLDGELTPERAAEIEAWLAGNEPARAQVTAWRNQRELVKAALDPVTAETVPTGMLSRLRRPQWRRYLMPSAAAAAVAFAIGLGSGWALWNGPEIDPDRDIVRAGLTAHRMYAAEVRHAVEVGSDDEEHLVSWLSKRVDAPVVPPDLSASGLKLLGGRLLPVENGNPGAMLMYEGRNGERYTVFITRSNEGRSTSFHYRDSGQNAAYYWNDKDVGYVVSGPAERDELLTVARSVYDQLD